MTTPAQPDAAWRLTDTEILQASRDGILPEAAAMIAINATATRCGTASGSWRRGLATADPRN